MINVMYIFYIIPILCISKGIIVNLFIYTKVCVLCGVYYQTLSIKLRKKVIFINIYACGVVVMGRVFFSVQMPCAGKSTQRNTKNVGVSRPSEWPTALLYSVAEQLETELWLTSPGIL